MEIKVTTKISNKITSVNNLKADTDIQMLPRKDAFNERPHGVYPRLMLYFLKSHKSVIIDFVVVYNKKFVTS